MSARNLICNLVSAAVRALRRPRFFFVSMNFGIVLVASSLLVTAATAQTPSKPSPPQSDAGLSTVTVEAERNRELLERRVNAFVSSITMAPYQQSLARWKKETPICPQVAGLPYNDGDFILSRFSQIAADAGATLAPNYCGANLRILVSSVPDELIAELSKRSPWMFGKAGGAKIREFLHSSAPVRVWYNTTLFDENGRPCKLALEDIPYCEQSAQSAQIRLSSMRDLTSVIVLVDARQIKDISMGQLAAYISMIGLAEIRMNAKLDGAPTILHLFSDFANAPALGVSKWDKAYLKALYSTEHDDTTQLLAVKAEMLKELAP